MFVLIFSRRHISGSNEGGRFAWFVLDLIDSGGRNYYLLASVKEDQFVAIGQKVKPVH